MTDRPGILIDAELARLQSQLDAQGQILDSLIGKYADQFRDTQALTSQVNSAVGEIGVLFGLWSNADQRLKALEPSKPTEPEPVPTEPKGLRLIVENGQFWETDE